MDMEKWIPVNGRTIKINKERIPSEIVTFNMGEILEIIISIDETVGERIELEFKDSECRHYTNAEFYIREPIVSIEDADISVPERFLKDRVCDFLFDDYSKRNEEYHSEKQNDVELYGVFESERNPKW